MTPLAGGTAIMSVASALYGNVIISATSIDATISTVNAIDGNISVGTALDGTITITKVVI